MSDRSSTTTPLRERTTVAEDGLRYANDAGLTYHDGGESTVLSILQRSSDLGSLSDELIHQADSWATRYHLELSRAHVVRALELDPASKVLEIGAGCGAVTRYLGERCALVDALEPMADRAICARERTRDLDNVEVVVGLLDDVPAEPAYDVVAVIGVLEYVGQGSADRSIYASFLARAAGLLNPGGTLVLAIENRLGVKYLAGAPEDHSGRSFENVEGYDQQSIARTFSRRELEQLVRETGLTLTTLGAFPDYKLSRAVFADALYEELPGFAAQLPVFPSPDWNGGPPRTANEARIWRTLVEAGLASHTTNSLVVLGHRGTTASELWPGDLLATYFSPVSRRPEYVLQNSVHRVALGHEVRRRRLSTVGDAQHLSIDETGDAVVAGRDFLSVIADSQSDDELRALLRDWQSAANSTHDIPKLDLLPHNAVLRDDGSIVFVDSKWNLTAYADFSLERRCALVLALKLAEVTSHRRWSFSTLGELAEHLAGILGVGTPATWLDTTLRQEARLQALLSTPQANESDEAHVERIEKEYRVLLAKSLLDFAGFSPELLFLRIDEAHHDVNRARHEVTRLESTRLFRYSRGLRSLYYRLRRTPS